MFKWAAAVIAAMLMGSALALLAQLGPAVRRLVRALVLGLAAVLLVAGLAIGVAGVTAEAWWALVVGGALALLALALGWRNRRPIERPSALTPLPSQDAIPALPPPDARWRGFAGELDFIGRRQAREAREAIAALLIERDSPGQTLAHRELITSLDRRVPELIDTCLERCRNARPDERERYLDETLERLRALGVEAEQARREIRAADDRRLETLHRYFDGTSGRRIER